MAFLRCPYCRKVLPNGAWGDPVGNWGSPFVTCPHCGKDCVDSSKHEPALKELKLPDLSVPHLLKVHFFPYGVLILLCMFAIWRSNGYSLLFLGFALLFLIAYAMRVYKDTKSKDSVYERMRSLYSESEKRLEDPAYIRALVSLKYDVPQKYLDYAAQFPQAEDSSED